MKQRLREVGEIHTLRVCFGRSPIILLLYVKVEGEIDATDFI